VRLGRWWRRGTRRASGAEVLVRAGAGLASDVAPSVIGALAGTAIAGPAGTIAGAAVAPVIQGLLGDLAQRALGAQAQARVGEAAIYAVAEIHATVESGGSLRDDGFFGSEPSSASEILEGVLLAARDSFEEKKVRYLGYLYATIACTDQISTYLANRLIVQAQRLTYRQLVLLAMIGDPADRPQLPSDIEVPADGQLTLETIGYLHDLNELYQESMIGQAGRPIQTLVRATNAQEMAPVGLGLILAEAMKLDRIPSEDRVARIFRGGAVPPVAAS
jgi:hypothetical protein